MDVECILHMKEGLGETSYAQNSSLQKKGVETLNRIIVDTAIEVYISETPRSLAIADLGCSSGPNALSLIGGIVDAIKGKCREASRPSPEFLVFLNDLPTNDFNALFMCFPEFTSKLKSGGASVFLVGAPGTFYGRLLPSSSLHFIVSCYSLHWLSQVPHGLFDDKGKALNKGKMYISETSPSLVLTTYFKQFQKDFSLFLKSRSKELISGGRMVLIMLGRRTQGHQDKWTTFLWEVLAQSFAIMVSQGKVEEEKVDSYNVPFYAPSLKEIEDEVHKEGSFAIDRLEIHELNSDSGDAKKDGRNTAMAIRAIQESMISHHFGDGIIDSLFQIYGELVTEAVAKERIKAVHLIVVLRKSP